MTGGRAGISAAGLEVARELLREKGHPDLVTGLQTKTHMGHPDWERELAAIQRAHAPAPVHIYFCGPAGLGKTIAKLATRLGMPFREGEVLTPKSTEPPDRSEAMGGSIGSWRPP